MEGEMGNSRARSSAIIVVGFTLFVFVGTYLILTGAAGIYPTYEVSRALIAVNFGVVCGLCALTLWGVLNIARRLIAR